MKKIVLVTGTGGFIEFITKFLLDKKFKVIRIDNINNYYNRKIKLSRLNILKNTKVLIL